MCFVVLNGALCALPHRALQIPPPLGLGVSLPKLLATLGLRVGPVSRAVIPGLLRQFLVDILGPRPIWWFVCRDPTCRRSLGLHHRAARHIISEDELDRMISLIETEGWKARVLKWEAQLEFEVTAQTIQKRMNERGYHKFRACSKIILRQENKDERYTFAALHQPDDYPLSAWIKHIFHDEVHFYLNSRKQIFIIRNYEERYHPTCLQNRLKGGSNIFHFAGLIVWNWKSPFREIQQTGPGGGYTYSILSAI